MGRHSRMFNTIQSLIYLPALNKFGINPVEDPRKVAYSCQADPNKEPCSQAERFWESGYGGDKPINALTTPGEFKMDTMKTVSRSAPKCFLRDRAVHCVETDKI